MSRSIQDIPGLTTAHLKSLRAAGIRTLVALLEAGGTPARRAALSERTGLPERSGVDGVDQLRSWNPQNLSEKLAQANAELHVCKITPKPLTVSHWVQQAKRLGPALER